MVDGFREHGVAVGVHVRSGDGIGHPLSIGRDLGRGDAMELDHVVEGDGAPGLLRARGDRSRRAAQQNRHHR